MAAVVESSGFVEIFHQPVIMSLIYFYSGLNKGFYISFMNHTLKTILKIFSILPLKVFLEVPLVLVCKCYIRERHGWSEVVSST
jgi:hypothetical protein